MGVPRKFAPVELRDLRSFQIRGFGNHLIFYRPIISGIEAPHVVHAARDLARFLESK